MISATLPITTNEIVAGVTRLAHQIDQHLQGDVREHALSQLRRDSETKAPFGVLAQLALLDDCLRVVHLASTADGLIEEDELARAQPVTQVAARKYCYVLPRYEDFHRIEDDEVDLAAFLEYHRRDRKPFGNDATGAWQGIALCRQAAAAGHRGSLLADHERMLLRIMDVVFHEYSGEIEIAARRSLIRQFERPRPDGPDPREEAFCRANGPEVFASVAHGAQLFTRDPFDVQSIHAEARDVFHVQIESAIMPIRHEGGHGRMMLVLGGSGSGKTHLMRALRTHVHGERLGYVGYLQMRPDSDDPARYVLVNLIDSLVRSYDDPELAESALLYLSDGLVGLLDDDGAAVARLRDDELDAPELNRFVGGLVDRLTRHERLHGVESDLVQALVMLQQRDPAVQRRVVKFLRCEALNEYEQGVLAGLSPRLHSDDPLHTIIQLGQLIFAVQQAALVLLVDQVEDALPDRESRLQPVAFQRAIDVLRAVTDSVPSSVVVIACLDDAYDWLRSRLTGTILDRLEREPPPVRLASERRREELREMTIARLDYLYDAVGAVWREDQPLFPFREEDIEVRANQRARDSLAWMHAYQRDCIRAGKLVPLGGKVVQPPETPFVELDAALQRALGNPIATGGEDEAVLELLERAIAACGVELERSYDVKLDRSGDRARLSVDGVADASRRIVEVCNTTTKGGHLGKQMELLTRVRKKGHIPVAVRESDFTFSPGTVISEQFGKFLANRGLGIQMVAADRQAIAAVLTAVEEKRGDPALVTWQRDRRPMSQLGPLRALLDLDTLPPRPMTDSLSSSGVWTGTGSSDGTASTASTTGSASSTKSSTPPQGVKTDGGGASAGATKGGELRLGVTTSMRADPVVAELQLWKRHAVFLGSSGSGKTTLALNVIEQLLERGVSALLVDRKGDLSRYADPAWWHDESGAPEVVARRKALRGRIDVALYTPGDANGRPLRLPVIPGGMRDLAAQEREQVAKIAADGLAVMMDYGRGETYRKRTAILKKAIELHGARDGTTIDDLRDSIGRPDPELLAAVGSLTRHFGALNENLETLAIQRGSLLTGSGESLDVQAMLAPPGARPRLSIINLAALGDESVLQFWVSRLLIELGRMVMRTPREALTAVTMFDEADIYMPAVSSPPTKEPMSNLLRRARSGGLGVFLATQNPGDLDYRGRDNIQSWFIGKVTQERGIEKVRNLLGSYPNVGTRLAAQPTGSFFALGLYPQPREFNAARSMMETVQLGDGEIARLARATI